MRRSLESKTFEPEELQEVLVKQGHDGATVAQVIERVSRELAAEDAGPGRAATRASNRNAARLIRAGVFVLMAGLVYLLVAGAGVLLILLVVAIGAGLIGAGYRGARM